MLMGLMDMLRNKLVGVYRLVLEALDYDMSSGLDSLLHKLSAFVEILQVMMINCPSDHQPQVSQ